MNRRRIAIAALAGLLAAGCGRAERDIEEARRAVNRVESGPHVYRYVETAEKRTVEATVEIEDSFRSRVTLAVDRTPVLEQVVVDDALALRLLAPDRWNPAQGTQVESVLGSGRWVIDPARAPSLFLPSTERQSVLTDVGKDPLFDAQNAFEYVLQAIDAAAGVSKFNPDSIFYKPSEDAFRSRVEADEDAGIERYIAVPPPLPRTAEQLQRQPGPRFFRSLSVYTKGGRAVRVLELIDFESHPELVKAKERREPRFLLELISSLRRGAGEEPIRPRSWSLEILSREPVAIALPIDALTANLKVLTSDRLAELPARGALQPAEQAA